MFKHGSINMFVHIICNLIIYSYINHINCILSKNKQLLTTDTIQLTANTYFSKYDNEIFGFEKSMVIMYNNVIYNCNKKI